MQLAAWWFRRDLEHRSQRALLGHIQSIIKNEESSMYEVHVRHIPAHRVMSVQRRVLQPELEAIMGCPESTQASDTIGIRIEPAHDVAYTRLTKAQFMFPEILGAYDAVASSPEVQERGSSALTCREIYLGGRAELADDDPAGDIAFPLA
jgi:hypothetical protein